MVEIQKKCDFTSISTRGISALVFCLMPFEHLARYKGFTVMMAGTLVNIAINVQSLAPYIIPDHPLLKWMFD